MQRLLLDDKKIERMMDNLRQVAALPDPIAGAKGKIGNARREVPPMSETTLS